MSTSSDAAVNVSSTPMPWLLLAVAVAGGLGTLARFGLSTLASRWGQAWSGGGGDSPTADGGLVWWSRWLGGVPGASPAGTLSVNALGCLAFGVIWGCLAERASSSWATPEVRLVVLTGFFGAFTTFSTFAFESTHLLRQGHVGAAAANVIVQNVVGLTLAFGGFALAQRWLAGSV